MNTLLTKLFSKDLFTKMVLTLTLVLGATQAWGDEIYFSNTSNTLTGWTKDANISIYSYSPYYLYSSGSTAGTLTSNNSIELSTYRKLTLRARRYIGTSVDPTITVKYSSDGANWNTLESYTKILESDSYQNIEVNLTGTYYIKLECYKIRIELLKLAISDPYPTPSNFQVNSTTENSAIFSWSQAKDETAWRIRYSTNKDFNPNNEGIIIDYESIDNFSYTLNGLTDGVTYYAYITADYGGGQYSTNWSEKISFTAGKELTINDGSTTNNNVPIYGYKLNYDFKSQIIIPKASLEDIAGRNIIQLTFYTSQPSINWGDAKFNIWLNEVEDNNTTYASSPVFKDWGTKVCSNATLTVSGNKLFIDFSDNPYPYNGKNLLIGFESTVAGTYGTSSWYGVEGSNNAAYYYYLSSSYTTARTAWLPKVTFRALSTTIPVTIGANGFTTFACARDLDLTSLPDGLKAYKAAVYAEEGKVRFTEINEAVAANTGMLLKGTPNTPYNIPVAETGNTPAGNAFLVNSTGGKFAKDENYTYYAMKKASESTDPLEFAKFNPSTVAIPTNKAYLKISNDDLEGREFSFSFEEETTGIQQVNSSKQTVDSYYNLAGQRVATPSKGLYIMNGKKVVMK